jgi:hypothetical protein
MNIYLVGFLIYLCGEYGNYLMIIYIFCHIDFGYYLGINGV